MSHEPTYTTKDGQVRVYDHGVVEIYSDDYGPIRIGQQERLAVGQVILGRGKVRELQVERDRAVKLLNDIVNSTDIFDHECAIGKAVAWLESLGQG